MNRLLRYLCGLTLLVGILLIPTGSADSSNDPAPHHEVTHEATEMQQAQQELPAARQEQEAPAAL